MKVCPVCGYRFPATRTGNFWSGYLRRYDKGEIEGLQYVRNFAKYRLASILLWSASVILMVASFGLSPSSFAPLNGSDLSAIASEFGVIAVASVSFLAGSALYLLGLYYLRQGSRC